LLLDQLDGAERLGGRWQQLGFKLCLGQEQRSGGATTVSCTGQARWASIMASARAPPTGSPLSWSYCANDWLTLSTGSSCCSAMARAKNPATGG
jgi:hypothetical protein